MKLHLDPQAIRHRIPLDWLERYQKGVAGPGGTLDDSRRLVRFGLIVVGLFFGVLLLWAAFMPLSGAAVASGVVTVAGNRQQLQTLNGGVVEEVMVREGQAVSAGQILVRMNGLQSGGRLSQSQAAADSLRAAEARLVAERDQLPAVAFPPELTARAGEPVVRQTMETQIALFRSRKAVFDADRRIHQERVRQARAEAASPAQQLPYIRDQLQGIRKLRAQGFAPKSTLYELERLRIELETAATAGRARAAEAELLSARAEEARTGEVVEQLRTVQTQLQQTTPELAVARYNAERDLVRAPANGRVVELERIASGSVVSRGQRLMDILPAGRSLVVEARVKPQDVDDVRVGMIADVRFTTVNPRGRSKVEGVVTTLSADRIADPQTGQSYFLAYIELDREQLGPNLNISPGIPATVNIRTRRRTVLDYIFAPLMDAFSHAGREE